PDQGRCHARPADQRGPVLPAQADARLPIPRGRDDANTHRVVGNPHHRPRCQHRADGLLRTQRSFRRGRPERLRSRSKQLPTLPLQLLLNNQPKQGRTLTCQSQSRLSSPPWQSSWSSASAVSLASPASTTTVSPRKLGSRRSTPRTRTTTLTTSTR